MRLRKTIGVLLVTAIATLAFAMTASADVGSFTGPGDSYKIDPSLDPQTTNVPYLAWVGETVKISKCFASSNEKDQLGRPGPIDTLKTARGFFDITGWSGVDENFGGPAFTGYDNGAGVASTREDFGHTRVDRTCFSVVIKSDKPGLAPVDLEVWQGATADDKDIRRDQGGATLVAQHRFLVIFMKSVKPSIVELKSTDQGGGGVGDPTGNGIFTPTVGQDLSETYGLVKINIHGTFPLGANWAPLGKATVTLPDDWEWLANHFASDKTNNAPGSTPNRWDIHDDASTGDGLFGIGGLADPFHPNMGLSPVLGANANKLPDHNVGSFCISKWGPGWVFAGKNLLTDAVDNCLGGLPFGDLADYGPFSNINGGHVAIGPFDQLRPFTSVFSDGKLTPWDAPMPALQVNVALGVGDIGALEKADKSDIYVVNSDLGTAYPHNLFAPFYKAYIPAVGVSGNTDPNIAANYGAFSEGRSGVYGKYENNVPGFIWPDTPGFFMSHNNGVYDYWTTYSLGYRDGYNACNDVLGDPYALPTGDNKVAVYTDEHGEAYVRFYPYTGLTLSPDGNNRCDLAKTNGVYGSAHITATSVYPEKWPTWDIESKDSNTLVKTANHLASKTLKCIAKGTNEGFCVETILGFNGAPIEGAKVKFTTSGDAANMDPDSAEFGGFDTRGQGIVDNPDGDDYVVLRTNSEGQVGVLITHSQNVCIDVTTENLGTRFRNRETGEYNPGVKRFFEFNPHTGAACGTSTGVGPTTDPGTGTGTLPENKPAAVASTPAVVVSLGGPVVQAQPVLQAGSKPIVVSNNATKLFSVKVLQTKLGRYLVVTVKGSAKTAKLRFAIMGKNGKVLKTFVRTVPTNKAFKIADLKLAKTAVSVKASVVA